MLVLVLTGLRMLVLVLVLVLVLTDHYGMHDVYWALLMPSSIIQ